MVRRKGVNGISQPSVQARLTPQSLLLLSSGAMWKCEKQSIMATLKKRIVKWGLSVAKVGLAMSVLMGSAGLSCADEFERFDGLDFGEIVQRGPM